jgi:hypothetical protein
MADKKISALTGATTPLAGTEVLPIVQSGATVKVSVDNLTVGRDVTAKSLKVTLGNLNDTVNLTNANGAFGNWTALGAGLLIQQKLSAPYECVMQTANAANSFQFPLSLNPSGGDVSIGSNLVIGTSGKGIDFSATSGTGTSELLADYEEGTWTPGITFGGASAGVTYTSTQGYYTKVGNVVTVSCYINMSNKGSSTGVARITALPFTCANNAAAYAAPSLFFANLTFTGQVNAYVNINDTTIDLFNTSVLGAASALTDTNFANNTGIIINLTYRAI